MRNFKKWIPPVIFLLLFLIANECLMMALRPLNLFRNDMHNLRTKQYDNVYVGTSHGKAAFHPAVLDEVTGKKNVNMCIGGQWTIDSYYILKEMLRYQKPEKVIYELDPGYWITECSLGPDYATVYEEIEPSLVKLEYFRDKMLDIDFRATLFPWYVYRQGYKNVIANLKLRTSDAYKNYEDALYSNAESVYGPDGALNLQRTGRPPLDYEFEVWDNSKVNEESVKYFEKIRKLCEEEGMELIVVTTPIPQETLAKYEKEYENAYDFVAKYMEERDISYYNFNEIEIEGFDRSVNSFNDYEGHMYTDMADIFSRKLGEILKGHK